MNSATVRAGTFARQRLDSRGSDFHWLLGWLAALHGAMLLYDLHNPDRFFNADRAEVRVQVIERLAQTWRANGDLGAFIAGQGIVGDWLPQAALYLVGGPLLVIVVQVLLALASVVWVRQIGLRLGLAPASAAGAAILYGLLPHTLVFPHQLASEAIFVPLVVLSFALALRTGSPPEQGEAGFTIGVASLVRPITVLWPLVHACLARRTTLLARLAYVGAALVPLGIWAALVHAETGELSLGRSKHDLGHNLYQRVQRMAPELPAAERFGDREDRRLGVIEYGRFVLEHPGPAAAHMGRDLLALGAKSGVERVILDYLDLYPEQRSRLQDWSAGWRQRLEAQGAAHTFEQLLVTNPVLVFTSAAGAVLFAGLMALAVVGALALAWRGRFMLAAFVLYVMLTAMAVDAAQSRHRAPAEFALCLLAATGLAALRRPREEKPYGR